MEFGAAVLQSKDGAAVLQLCSSAAERRKRSSLLLTLSRHSDGSIGLIGYLIGGENFPRFTEPILR